MGMCPGFCIVMMHTDDAHGLLLKDGSKEYLFTNQASPRIDIKIN
jgi:hypothetical protein